LPFFYPPPWRFPPLPTEGTIAQDQESVWRNLSRLRRPFFHFSTRLISPLHIATFVTRNDVFPADSLPSLPTTSRHDNGPIMPPLDPSRGLGLDPPPSFFLFVEHVQGTAPYVHALSPTWSGCGLGTCPDVGSRRESDSLGSMTIPSD